MTADQLLPLASKMAMPASALVALATVVEVFARKSGMAEKAMLDELLVNEPLRRYAEQLCMEATK